MTTPKKVRWECPSGEHPGVLGSTRPPMDSLTRYCLPCSTRAGKLVPRVAPALERKREAAAASQATKAKQARAREAAKKKRAQEKETERYTVEGVDLRDEMQCLLRLRVWQGHFGRPGPDGGFHNRPELVISKRAKHPQQLGLAQPWRNRIIVATWPGQSLADARETLVHELCHLVVGQHDTGAWHGPEFHETLRRAMKQAYGVDPVGLPGNRYHGRYAAALKRKETGS